jgi:hypothetical protein
VTDIFGTIAGAAGTAPGTLVETGKTLAEDGIQTLGGAGDTVADATQRLGEGLAATIGDGLRALGFDPDALGDTLKDLAPPQVAALQALSDALADMQRRVQIFHDRRGALPVLDGRPFEAFMTAATYEAAIAAHEALRQVAAAVTTAMTALASVADAFPDVSVRATIDQRSAQFRTWYDRVV